MPTDFDSARKLLSTTFAQAESDLLRGAPPEVDPPIAERIEALFASRTQAYREALLGCILARVEDRRIDIRLPYVGQGERAFNGRTLDEKVVNPFLKDKQIPSSRGPYLGVFRRNVRFDQATRRGLRDTPAYDALLAVLYFYSAVNAF
jgi:hypothetical protein